MVSTSKVLTVSYGTFSCTLEGFDESFETMKAIAEYFRDLAADDRYFGAEPPTPDAEMLARIAEREIARRVEAHQDDGGIVLRAAQSAPAKEATPAPAALPEPEAAETPGAEPEAETTSVGHDDESDAPGTTIAADPPHEPAPQPEPEPEPEPDSVAARLRRIRSVVSHAPDAEAEYSEDEHAQDFLSRTAADLDATLAEDDTAEHEFAGDEDQDDTIAALTARLTEERVETETPEGIVAHDEIEEYDPDAGLSEDRDDDFDDSFAEDTLAQLLADAMPPEAARADHPEEPGAEPDAQDEAAQAPMQARVLKLKRSMLDAAIEEGRIEEVTDANESTEEGADEGPGASAEGEEEGDDTAEVTLSPEEEAELRRELAEVEAELAEDTLAEDTLAEDTQAAAPEAAAGMSDEPRTAGEAPRAAHLHHADADSDAARLFDTADSHFGAADASRRRNAIQHLRAAVAASKAETSAGGTLEGDDGSEEAAYRSDLARVVRPRRPQSAPTESTPRPVRPGEGRPAPLKLVAEQRVDTPREPVRPRRVATPPPAPVEMAASAFGEYADEIGATTLTELLEAAASYLADVEGREQFSRPMLMGMLKEVSGDAFSREDGLRSFGHLLREGKLQKLQGGRFTVTDQTEFRAAERRAG